MAFKRSKAYMSRKRTFFKKGNTDQKKREYKKAKQPAKRNFNRPSKKLYDLGVRGHNGPISILRSKPSDTDHELEKAKGDHGPYITSNRIVSMEEFQNILTEVYQEHKAAHPRCNGSFKMPQKGEQFFGLGSKVTVLCECCTYVSAKKRLFEPVQEERKGPITAVANDRLAQWMENTSVSIDDTRLLFSTLNMHSPGESTICRHIKKMRLKKQTKVN